MRIDLRRDDKYTTAVDLTFEILPHTLRPFLRELRPTDLEGSAGLYRLKEELTRRVNIAIAPNHVNAVLFKEIVVQ